MKNIKHVHDVFCNTKSCLELEETKPMHTPTPWRVGDAGHTVFGPKIDPYPYESIAPTIIASNIRNSDNAAFIVRAVNFHQGLVDIIKSMHNQFKLHDGILSDCDICIYIARAEGKRE